MSDMIYTMGTFEADTLKRIVTSLQVESMTPGAVDLLHLATAASALNALVAMCKANMHAEMVGRRLDGALEKMAKL